MRFSRALCPLAIALAGCGTFHRIRPPPTRSYPLAEPATPAGLRAYWVGHATVLVGMDGRWVLTDPNFSNTVAHVARRYYRPGIPLADLPPIDLVLISHSHLDHLDVPTLRRLDPGAVVVCAPGACRYVPRRFRAVIQLAPWRTTAVDGLVVTAVPARHAGARRLLNFRGAEAVGFVVEYRGQSFYFAGDTGYEPAVFSEVARRFPRIDLALLPVGPVNGWITRHVTFRAVVHMSPGQAVAAFRLLGARYMIPIHWRTFFKSTPYEEERVAGVAAEDPGRVVVLDVGQSVFIPRATRRPSRAPSPSSRPPRPDASARPRTRGSPRSPAARAGP